MDLKHLVIFYYVAVLAHGDLLLDYAQKKLEGLPNWILENVEDSFSITTEDYSKYNRAFMSYSLKPFNLTVNGLKSTQISGNPTVFASLFAGSLSVQLTVVMGLELLGNYEVTGTLFPYVEQIPYTSAGIWSANTTLTMTTLHRIYGSLEVSMEGSMNAEEFEMTHQSHWILNSNFYFEKFLEDHSNQWYYPTINEGFEVALKAHVHLNINEKINLFEKFFEETFKNIDYSDMIEGKS